MVFRAQVGVPGWRYGDHCDHSYPGLLRDGCSEKSKSILPSVFVSDQEAQGLGGRFRRTSISSFGRWCSLPWAVLHWAKLSSAAVYWKPWTSSSERWFTACRCTALFFCSPASFWYVAAYVWQCFLFSLTRVIRLFPRSSATQSPVFCWCQSLRKSELTCQVPQPDFSSS